MRNSSRFSLLLTAGLVTAEIFLPHATTAQPVITDDMNATELLETYLMQDITGIKAYGDNLVKHKAADYKACTTDLKDLTATVNETMSDDPFSTQAAAHARIDYQILIYYNNLDYEPCPSAQSFAEYGRSAFLPHDPLRDQVINQSNKIELNLDLTDIISYQYGLSTANARSSDYVACTTSAAAINHLIQHIKQEIASPQGAPQPSRDAYDKAQKVMQRYAPDYCPPLK
jgi:hypothetical protein